MPGTKKAEGNPNPRTRSVAACAQLLELWEQGRVVLEQDEARYYVLMLSELDALSRECYAYHFGEDVEE